ncbi:MAG TPA: ABC transporter substrate-binding protein [Ilumatobacteraceae bacterium]|nr:ABC transporter substrate-binding protein [Ilumatobacteraceae bacterium]
MKRLTAFAAAVVLVVSCGSGKSIITAGRQPPVVTQPAPVTLPPGETLPVGETLPPIETTIAPTTTAALLDTLPKCPTEALAAATSPVNITFWHGLSGPLGDELQKLADVYNATQSKVKVSLIEGTYEETIDKYLQSGQSSRPDLVQMPEYMVQTMVDTQSNVPVEACIKASGFDTSAFLPTALDAYATQGVQWSMPFNISNPVLFYNKKMFAAAGLDPEKPPVSLDDLRADSQAIVTSGAAKYGLALDSGFDSGGGWYIEQWFAKAGEFYADNQNGRSARATQVLYNNATGQSLLTFMQSMLADGLAVNVGDNTNGFDNLLKLADTAEPAAMTIATSASIGPVIAVLGGGQFPQITNADVGVAAMPGPDGKPGALIGGASLWIVDSGDDARTAAAWDFVTYLTQAQQQSEWSSTTGYLPVRTDALTLDPLKTTLATDPRFKVPYDQLLSSPDAPTSVGPVVGPLREVRTVTAQAVAAIFAGADVATSLAAAAQQADALIADYNSRNG